MTRFVSFRGYILGVARPASRLNVTLDAEYAAKLSRLADVDARHAAELLDGIPGAYERALVGHMSRRVRAPPFRSTICERRWRGSS
jgi:hypothetical protein